MKQDMGVLVMRREMMRWEPKTDLTALELATALRLAMLLTVDEVAAMPESVQRHFRNIETNPMAADRG